jgi:16S rRNA (guanine966-N2)-methyltransferase
MKISGGIASGIHFFAPEIPNLRPVLERSRISLFSSLVSFDDMFVADLFAGSGAFGIEAASRGASEVLFVEKNGLACSAISKNLEAVKKAGVESKFHVLRSDIFSFLRRQHDINYDYVFLDPPYSEASSILKRLLEDENFAKFAGTAKIIVKIPEKFDLSFIYDSKFGILSEERRFGGTDFIFLKIKFASLDSTPQIHRLGQAQ